MQRWTLPFMSMMLFVGMALNAPAAMAQSERQVTAAFGRGLNTAFPGNVVNHAIIPGNIGVRRNGVVSFIVSGFHQIVVYKPRFDLDDVNALPILSPPNEAFVEVPTEVKGRQLYLGINPAGGPLATAGTTNPSNASNRVESLSFADPGLYLVICNIRGHFEDGMFAFVTVTR